MNKNILPLEDFCPPVEQTHEQIAIRCATTRRLMARADEHGVYFFCRQHKEQHCMSWQALDRLRESIFHEGPVQEQVI